MKNFFLQNKISRGILAVLGAEAVAAFLLWLVLTLFGLSINLHYNWFAAIFVPGILALRQYAKLKEYPNATKAAIISFAITFIAYMWFMLKNNYIVIS